MRLILSVILAAGFSGAAYAADVADDVIRYAPPPAMEIEADSLPASLTMRSVYFDDSIYRDWLAARGQDRYAGKSAGVHLNCRQQPGAKMCLRARQLSDTIFASCSGEYCTMLWEKGTSYLREITYAYENISVSSADEEIGMYVKYAVEDICNSRLNASSKESKHAMRSLVMSANLAMPVFVDIQRAAGIEPPAKCRLKVN